MMKMTFGFLFSAAEMLAQGIERKIEIAMTNRIKSTTDQRVFMAVGARVSECCRAVNEECLNFCMKPRAKKSTLDHIDLNRLNAHADFFEPLDGCLDVRTVAVQFKTDDADFIRHAGLADVRDDGKFLRKLPDQRLLDKFRRIHQPKARLLATVCRSDFLCVRFIFGRHGKFSNRRQSP